MLSTCIIGGCTKDTHAINRSVRLDITLKDAELLRDHHKAQITEFIQFYKIYSCKFIVFLTYAEHTNRNVIRNRIKHIRKLFITNHIPDDNLIIVENYGPKSTIHIIMKFIDIV